MTNPNNNAVVIFRNDLGKMQHEFAKMLPAHIPADRFCRIIVNATNRTPKLLGANRQTLWNACMQAAEDGLIPDGREGAIVPFKKGKDDDGVAAGGEITAVWIPMVGGIRKLVRNSGELRDLNVQIVYEDEVERGAFIFELGDSPTLKHKRLPPPDGKVEGRAVHCCYSLAWDKDGHLLVPEVMFEAELMATASRSKSYKSGPWSDPLYALEMRKKTCTKRHFKQLPTSRDLDRVLRRDDALYDFAGAERQARESVSTIRGGASAQLAHFAQEPMRPVREPEKVEVPANEPEPDEREDEAPAAQEEPQRPEKEAKPKKDETPEPKTAAEYAKALREYLKTAKSADAIEAKWKRERDLRNKLNVEPELRDALESEKSDAVKAIREGSE